MYDAVSFQKEISQNFVYFIAGRPNVYIVLTPKTLFDNVLDVFTEEHVFFETKVFFKFDE